MDGRFALEGGNDAQRGTLGRERASTSIWDRPGQSAAFSGPSASNGGLTQRKLESRCSSLASSPSVICFNREHLRSKWVRMVCSFVLPFFNDQGGVDIIETYRLNKVSQLLVIIALRQHEEKPEMVATVGRRPNSGSLVGRRHVGRR